MSDPRDVLGPVLAEAVEQLVAEQVAAALVELECDADARRWPEYLDVPTAAEFLGCSVERVRKLIARRAVPVVQEERGHRVHLARADLVAYMAAHRRDAAD